MSRARPHPGTRGGIVCEGVGETMSHSQCEGGSRTPKETSSLVDKNQASEAVFAEV